MSSRFPERTLSRILSREELAYFVRMERRVEELEDILSLNSGVLMSLYQVEIETRFIPDVPTLILTARQNVSTILDKLSICGAAGAADFSAWLVPAGGSVGDGTLVVNAVASSDGGLLDPASLQGRPMNPGTELWVSASVPSVLTVGGAYSIRERRA